MDSNLKKSCIAFIRALLIFFLFTNVYMVVFFIISTKLSSTSMLGGNSSGNNIDSMTMSDSNATTTIPGVCTKIKNETKKKQKKKKKLESNERPIRIIKKQKVVQIEQPRSSLTQDQLYKIHIQMEQEDLQQQHQQQHQHQHQQQYYIQQLQQIENTNKALDSLFRLNAFVSDNLDHASEQLDPDNLFHSKSNPTIQTNFMHGTGSAKEAGNNDNDDNDDDDDDDELGLSNLVSFLKHTSTPSQLHPTMGELELVNNIYHPIHVEIESFVKDYMDGKVEMKQLQSLFDHNGIQFNQNDHGDDDEHEHGHEHVPLCNDNYLKVAAIQHVDEFIIDDDHNDEHHHHDDETKEEEEHDENVQGENQIIYATKDDLKALIQTTLDKFIQYYSIYTTSSGKDSDEDEDENNLPDQPPLTAQNLLQLQNRLMALLKDEYNIEIDDFEFQIDTFVEEAENFQKKVNRIIRKNNGEDIGNRDDDYAFDDEYAVDDDEDDSDANENDDGCVTNDMVEEMMKFALENVIHNGIDVSQAMKMFTQKYNNEQQGTINIDKLEDLPSITYHSKDSAALGDTTTTKPTTKTETLKEFMNTPIVPEALRVVDEGIEMIAGNNDGVDFLIDFIAGLNSDETDKEKQSVGKTIEAGLLKVLDKVEVPSQMTGLSKKAGILLQNN